MSLGADFGDLAPECIERDRSVFDAWENVLEKTERCQMI